MSLEDFVLSIKNKSSSGSIGVNICEAVKEKRKGTSDGHLSVATGPVKLDCVLHVLKTAQKMGSVAALCNDVHNNQLTGKFCVINNQSIIMSIGRRTDEMYTVNLKKVEEPQSIAILGKDVSVLDVCHARLSYTDCCAVKKMVDKDVVWDMDMGPRSLLDDCSLCIEQTLTEMPMPLRPHREVWPGAGINSDVAAMNMAYIGTAEYLITFISEVSGHVRAFQVM